MCFLLLILAPTRVSKKRVVASGGQGVELPFSMNWGDLMQAPQVDDTSDFHCVTTWSKLNMRWRGISLWSVILQAQPHEQAVAAMCYGADGYTTNLSLSAIREPGGSVGTRIRR